MTIYHSISSHRLQRGFFKNLFLVVAHTFLVWLLTVSTCSSQSPCLQGYDPVHYPRDRDAICLPKIGSIAGLLGGPNGRPSVYALGDINNDSIDDWVMVTDRRHPIYPNSIRDVRVFLGKRGELPKAEDAQIIRMTDTISLTTLVGWGDFDHDGRVDLACRVEFNGDTSNGNTQLYDISRLVVFWGQDSGKFTLNDTTQLMSNAPMWVAISGSVRVDIDEDGIDDLCIQTYGGFGNGNPITIPRFHIFKGLNGKRWGRNGEKRTADWVWWKIPGGEITVADQDSDGNPDFIFTDDNSAYISILYGNTKSFPDTSSVQILKYEKPISYQCESLLSDVTGDGVPELIVLSAAENKVRIYAGCRGQRLLEQFGTGDDPPHPDSLKWWGKPWAQVSMAHAINTNWLASTSIYAMGDLNLDGITDISVSGDYLSSYTMGTCMDSLIDGLIPNNAFTGNGTPIVLGNVLGDGRVIIGTGRDFFVGSNDVPSNCYSGQRRMPHLTTGISNPNPVPNSKQQLDLSQQDKPIDTIIHSIRL